MIEIKNLGGAKVRALDGISLTMIGGDTPTSGSVRIDGVDIHRLEPSALAVLRRRSIGVIYLVLGMGG